MVMGAFAEKIRERVQRMTNGTDEASGCPLCGKDNNCGNLQGKPHGTCWCSRALFPKEIFDLLPQNRAGKSCICKSCLDQFKANN
jgi:hypothetical protein